jgi:hypothetical protein
MIIKSPMYGCPLVPCPNCRGKGTREEINIFLIPTPGGWKQSRAGKNVMNID